MTAELTAPPTQFKLQADQYAFPYHYLVDLRAQTFNRQLDWGLDYASYMTKVLSLVNTYVTTDILDVGCGDGFMLVNLAQQPGWNGSIRAVGIDVDERPILFARAFGHGLPNVTFGVQDLAGLDDAFGTVSVIETFEHIPDALLPSFIADIDRLLRPGGTLIVSVPSKARPVLDKHYRHYDLALLQHYFPAYDVLTVHHVTARNNLIYQLIARLLAHARANRKAGAFKRLLLALHARFFNEVSPRRGAHVVAAFQKPS